jgi:hypothetical protein
MDSIEYAFQQVSNQGFVSTALPSIGTSGTTRFTEVHELDSGGITLDFKKIFKAVKISNRVLR